MDDGFQVAVGFSALGILVLFIGQMLLLSINWMRRLMG